jgi:hypothetical protein
MVKTSFDTFVIIVNFLNNDWVPQHVMISFKFEVPNTYGATFVEIVKPFLVQFQLTNKVLIYVKDEGSNLSTLESVDSTTTSCKLLELKKPFACTCFGHVI